MIIDGLFMSLIGLAVVFLVLIVLLICIYMLNFFDNKSISGKQNKLKKNDNEPDNKNFLGLELTAALVGVSLALSESNNLYNFIPNSDSRAKNSNWSSTGLQRLFKGRGS